ncbi:MAG: ABC transporter substrate-binding protein [Rhodobacteraceae bacterium]|nr:ABC transporter substrate-binding protein [Paracoccaceae bacterium]
MTDSSTRPLAFTRRTFIATSVAATGTALASPALAVSRPAARQLVEALVGEINRVIASGRGENAMLNDFERIFDQYSDVQTIAGYVLGVERRRASAAQLRNFTAAYKVYISRLYGRRFREFIGGEVVVVTARDLPRGVEVETVANLRGQSPFRVDFHIEDSRGRPLFFNIVIEGINMLLSERQEIQARLDRLGGDLDRLIADLRSS